MAGGTPARVRRSRTLLVYWEGDQVVFENYRTRVAVTADPQTLSILNFFDRWRRPDDILRHLNGYTPNSVRDALRRLVAVSLLVEEHTPEAERDARVNKIWGDWLPHAGFHFATKDLRYVGVRRGAARLRAFLARSPQPPFFKSYPRAKHVRLPPADRPEYQFLRVLTARKTHRSFSEGRLRLEDLATLLFYTWGVTGFFEVPVLGNLPHKTSPSGGARHPGEVYVVALRVQGLRPGLYHYNARRHQLEELRRGTLLEQVVQYCGAQPFVRKASAVFLMTAVFPRVMWKYRHARYYRVVLLDAGHLAQTFCLVATWLGLAPFSLGALNDSLIEKDLGLDGIGESAIYVTGVGLPRGRPAFERSSSSRRSASLPISSVASRPDQYFMNSSR